MFKETEFSHQVVIISGGSGGIGSAMVRAFAAAGAKVFFFYHKNHDNALRLQQQMRSKQCDVTGLPVDVTNQKQCEDTITQIFNKTQRIDVVVNNSGILQHQSCMSLTSEDITNIMAVNVIGVLNVTNAIIPYFEKMRQGKIINISSVAGTKGSGNQTSYAASKGLLDAITRAWAIKLAPFNVMVNAVAPGVIKTVMTEKLREYGESLLLSKILLKRFGEPEEVANTVLFLASKYANYITGETVYVDGGYKSE